MAADNQQERLDPEWVVGFAEGEGCFRVSINRQPKMSTGWQVLPEFRLVQHKRNKATLQKLQQFFGAGDVGEVDVSVVGGVTKGAFVEVFGDLALSVLSTSEAKRRKAVWDEVRKAALMPSPRRGARP